MFDFDLQGNKESLVSMLSINYKWLFDKGRICTLNDQKYVFCTLETDIKVRKPTLNDVDILNNLLKRKTIVKVKISPERGFLLDTRHKFNPRIPVLDEPELEKSIKRFYSTLLDLEYASKRWVDLHKNVHNVTSFKVENIELDDTIRLLGETENLKLQIHNNRLILKNMRTNVRAQYPEPLKIKGIKKATVNLSSSGRTFFMNSLLGEKSTIKIANNAMILVTNSCKTAIAGRTE